MVKTMKKTTTVALSFLLVSVFLFGSVNVGFVSADPVYDRTDELGILISAWTMDDHGITPAQVKDMIDEAYSRKGVEYKAVKITYGFVPSNGAQYTADRIGVWVDYFDDYFEDIYVTSRSVFHIERKLTPAEYTDYYSRLADVLNDYPAVKGFMGEEEVEAKQIDPYTGDPEGNNLAYSSWSDMKQYVINLYNTWHNYSSIPFSFASIPMAEMVWQDSDYYYINPYCWFFDRVSVWEYWEWIDDYQDFFSIDEWRYHFGVQEWADHVNEFWYFKYIVIGESFNLDYSETQRLYDAFYSYKYPMGYYNHLKYAFWWQVAGSEPVSSEYAGAPQDYLYFGGGYKGHCWAFNYMKSNSPNHLPGANLEFASAHTYSEGADQAIGSSVLSGVSTHYYDEMFTSVFNFDMHSNYGNEGYDAVLGYWALSDGRGYSIVGHYGGVEGDVSIGVSVPYLFGDHASISFPAKTNVWSWVSIIHYEYYIGIEYGYELPNGTIVSSLVAEAYDVGIVDDLTIGAVYFGAWGGQLCKLYVGSLGYSNVAKSSVYWIENFYNLNNWSLYYTEPSCITLSNSIGEGIIYNNGPLWMQARLRYNVDY
jgi:hypothetical protein